MTRVKFQLEPLTCPSCIKKIEGKVGEIGGVEEVKVLFNSSKVKVDYDEEQVAPEELKTVIEKLGYPVMA
ncbi:heavy-metal-associated domain-containing protein [Planococcus sp. ISL-110]|uniref:heavy-metal-associated domain-containing protein n=1 Tax=Planococcus sp. ISL-110 TaxID=2819167 RepID=UPI001BE91F4B|nr:heavy-metal-associated domain-containing protein [Planococcus sp. ISL-110]MBT2569557.1 heavy-metal-associated domain-containing protein [Planococcus sp. ISL-110]